MSSFNWTSLLKNFNLIVFHLSYFLLVGWNATWQLLQLLHLLADFRMICMFGWNYRMKKKLGRLILKQPLFFKLPPGANATKILNQYISTTYFQAALFILHNRWHCKDFCLSPYAAVWLKPLSVELHQTGTFKGYSTDRATVLQLFKNTSLLAQFVGYAFYKHNFSSMA